MDHSPPFSLYTTSRQGDHVDPSSPEGKIRLDLVVDDGLRRRFFNELPRGEFSPTPVVGILRLGRSGPAKALVCVRSAPSDNFNCCRRGRAADVVNGRPPLHRGVEPCRLRLKSSTRRRVVVVASSSRRRGIYVAVSSRRSVIVVVASSRRFGGSFSSSRRNLRGLMYSRDLAATRWIRFRRCAFNSSLAGATSPSRRRWD